MILCLRPHSLGAFFPQGAAKRDGPKISINQPRSRREGRPNILRARAMCRRSSDPCNVSDHYQRPIRDTRWARVLPLRRARRPSRTQAPRKTRRRGSPLHPSPPVARVFCLHGCLLGCLLGSEHAGSGNLQYGTRLPFFMPVGTAILDQVPPGHEHQY